MNDMELRIRLERLLALLVICVENVIHGGLIFGWPSLVFVLKDLGYFDSSCFDSRENATNLAPSNVTTQALLENGSTSAPSPPSYPSCPGQDSALQLVFTVVTAIQTLCMFPVGFFFDRFGTRISRLVMTILLLFGYMLMAFSSRTYPFLIYPATIFFTIAGVMLLLSSVQIGNLFKSQKSTVIAIINSMYSASVLVFLIAKVAYDFGFNINIFFFIFAGSTTFLTINTILFYPINHIPWPLPKNYRVPIFQPGTCFTVQYEDRKDEPLSYDNTGFVGDENRAYTDNDGRNSGNGSAGYGATTDTQASRNDPPGEMDDVTTRHRSLEELKMQEYTSLKSCVISLPFFLILVWQMLLELDLYFIFGSLNTFLTRLAEGEESEVSWYTNVFSITQLFVVVVGPFGGLLMDRNKLRGCRRNGSSHKRAAYADMQDSCLPLALTSLVSILYSGCMLVPSLPVQYLSFVFILIQRSLLYGVGSAIVAVIFPMRFFASVYGAVRTTSGCFSFLQYPIFFILQHYLNDDLFYIIIAFIVGDTLTLILPVALYVRARRMSTRASEYQVTPVSVHQ